MGQVFITDELGEVLWEGHNSLSAALEQELLHGLLHRGNPPSYCGVGATYASLTDTPWEATKLESEMARRKIDGTFVDPLNQRAHLITAFRQNDVNTIWRELALFDRQEHAYYGDRIVTSCDSLNSDSTTKKWTTGSGGVLVADPSSRTEGTAGLLLQAGTADPLYSNDGLALRPPPDESPLHDLQNMRLQMHLSISDKSKLSGSGLIISAYSSSAVTDGWQWTLQAADLSDGSNFLDLHWSDAADIGSPPSEIVVESLRITAPNRQSDMVFVLDGIRIYHDEGVLYARTEIHPAITKQSGSRVVTWVLEPFSGL